MAADLYRDAHVGIRARLAELEARVRDREAELTDAFWASLEPYVRERLGALREGLGLVDSRSFHELARAEDACRRLGAMALSLADAADEPLLEPAPGETPVWQSVLLRALFDHAANPSLIAATLATVLDLPPESVLVEHVADRAWEREWLKDFRPTRFGRRWAHELCTGEPELPPNGSTLPARAQVPLPGRALRVLRRVG